MTEPIPKRPQQRASKISWATCCSRLSPRDLPLNGDRCTSKQQTDWPESIYAQGQLGRAHCTTQTLPRPVLSFTAGYTPPTQGRVKARSFNDVDMFPLRMEIGEPRSCRIWPEICRFIIKHGEYWPSGIDALAVQKSAPVPYLCKHIHNQWLNSTINMSLVKQG